MKPDIMSLKKTTFFLVLLLIFTISTDLQAQKSKSLWLEAKAGLNTSVIINQNAYGNGEMDYATTFGLTAGLGANYYLTEKWGVNASFNWSKLGQNYSGMQSSGDAKRKVKLNYLEVPLLALRRVGRPKNLTWVSFGPEIMFLLNAKQEYERENGGPLPKPDYLIEGTTDITNRYKPIDIALSFAISKIYDVYQNRNFRFLISANMAVGLSDINSKEWKTPNMHGSYAGSHNFYMGIKAGIMYKAFVKKE